MLRIISALLAAIGIVAVMFITNTGTANASIVQTYGHNDTWWDVHGNITCSTCADRALRVGAELRRTSEGTLDMNACVDQFSVTGIVRESIDSESIIKDSTSTIRTSTPGVIGTDYFCVDLDPNVGVCGPTRSSNFLGHVDVGVRRSDGVLLHVFGNSLNSTMPCD